MLTQIQRCGETIVLESDALRVEFEPQSGGKIRSLLSKRTEFEYLYQDVRRGLSKADYSNHDISGFDECFPTVLACEYPHDPWRGMSLGDHGLLWDRPWDTEVLERRLISQVALESVPLTFSRTAELEDSRSLLLRYAVENRATASFEYLYAAHLMLRVDSTTRIVYPPEMTRAFIAVAIDNPLLKEGQWRDWPPADESLVKEPLLPRHGTLVKAFSPKLTQGIASLTHAESQERLMIEFSAEQLPYLGILLAPGYGPLGKDPLATLLAIEPTSSIADDLAMARKTQTSRRIPAGQSIQFWLRLSLQQSLDRN